MNAMRVIRRVLSLTVLLATGAAQAMATACPMGITDGGDHPVMHFGSTHDAAHGDPNAAAPSPAHHRVSRADQRAAPTGGPDSGASRASAPVHVPFDTGAPCELTMSCAPLIPTPSQPLGTLGRIADVASVSLSNQVVSADTNAATPPPRPLV